jgi:hypothetical protein
MLLLRGRLHPLLARSASQRPASYQLLLGLGGLILEACFQQQQQQELALALHSCRQCHWLQLLREFMQRHLQQQQQQQAARACSWWLQARSAHMQQQRKQQQQQQMVPLLELAHRWQQRQRRRQALMWMG